MKRIVMLLAVFCLIGVTGAIAGADPEGLPPGKWWMMPEAVEKLGLTADEQSRLETLFAQHRRNMFDLKNNMEKERFELEQILDSGTLDEAAAMERFKRFQDARNALGNERFKHVIEVRKILGVDRYLKLKAEFQKRRHDRMKRMHGGPGPMQPPDEEMPDRQ